MNRRFIYLILISVFFSLQTKAQVGVGTTTPDASAQLEVYSISKGLLIPRLTSAQKSSITSPATGLLVYQTDNTPGFYFYNAGEWKRLASSAEAGTGTGNGSQGNSLLNGTSDPGSATGNNGDFYINTSTYTLFGPKASGSWPATGAAMLGVSNVSMGGFKLTNLAAPTNNRDAVNKKYVDDLVASAASKFEPTLSLDNDQNLSIKGGNSVSLADLYQNLSLAGSVLSISGPRNSHVDLSGILALANGGTGVPGIVYHDETLVGTGQTSSKLSVNDQGITAFKLKNVTTPGGTGQVLSSDGLGGFKWADQGGLSAIPTGTVLGNNTGVDGTPKAMSIGDLKAMLALSATDVGLGNVKNVDQTNASNLTSGYIPAARFQTGSIPASAIAGNNLSDYYLSGKGTWVQLPTSTDDQTAAEVAFDNSLTPGLGNTVQSAISDLNNKIGTVPSGALTQISLASGSMLQGKGTSVDPLKLSDITGPSFIGRISGTGTPSQVGIGNGLIFGSDSKLSVDFSGVATLAHNHSLDGLSNVNTVTKSVNDILQWNGSNWVNVPASVAGGGFSGVSTDGTTVGGDGKTTPLYLVNKAVSFNKMADITGPSLIGKAATGSGSPEKIGIGNGLTVTGTSLGLMSGGSNGDILQWDGTQWQSKSLSAAGIPTGGSSVTFAPSGTGDVTATSVTGTTLVPVLSIRDGVVGTNKISDGAITAVKLADGAISLSGSKVTGTIPSASLPADLGTGKTINGITFTNTGSGVVLKDASSGSAIVTASNGSTVSGNNTGDQNAAGVTLTNPVAGKNNVQDALDAISNNASQAISFQTTGGDVSAAAPVSSRTSLSPTLNINNDAITSAKIKDGAVTAAKLGTAAVDLSGSVVTGSLPALKASLSAPVLGKTNVQDALTALESKSAASITGISSGAGISGGGTSGNITLSLATNGISASNLKGMGNAALANGTSGYVLQSNGDGTFSWFNLSSGVSADPSTLALNQGQFYVGNSANKAEATAKTLIPLSGFGTPQTDIDIGGYKLLNVAYPSNQQDAATKKYVDDQIASASPSLALDALSNVAVTGKATNDLIQWNGSKWVNKTISNAIPAASTSTAGLMSSADKTKIDGLSNYTLPAATSTTLGGVIVESGSGLSLNAGKLSVNPASLSGLVKSVSSGAGISVSATTGDVTIGVADDGITTSKIVNEGVTLAKIEKIATHTLLGNSTGVSASPQAITLGSGLAFSGSSLALDPASLPVASATTSGTVKVGSGLKMTSGVLSVDASSATGLVTGISGPEITVTPNSPTAGNSYVSLNNSSITTSKIADANVTLAKLQNLTGKGVLLGSPSTANSVSEITVGSGLSLSGNVLTATGGGGSGTVTTVGVATANGFAGDVANATSTPQLTLKTTVNGLLQGNGTSVSAAATTGTGSVVLASGPTLTGATIAGTLTGNASTATDATNAANTAITTAGSSGTVYPTFVTATTGNLPQKVSSSLTYNLASQELNAKIQPSNIVGYPSSGTVYLAGDGTWKAAAADLSNLKLSYATTTTSGTMTLMNGATSLSSQVISLASSSNPGLMSKDDKTRLDALYGGGTDTYVWTYKTSGGAQWAPAPSGGGSSITGITYTFDAANAASNPNAVIGLSGTSYTANVPVLTDGNSSASAGLMIQADKTKVKLLPSASPAAAGQVITSTGTTASAWTTPALSFSSTYNTGTMKLKLGTPEFTTSIPEATSATSSSATDGSAGLLNANDKYKLNNTLPSPTAAGQVLTSTGAGTASWQTASGGGGGGAPQVYLATKNGGDYDNNVVVKAWGDKVTYNWTKSADYGGMYVFTLELKDNTILDYVSINVTNSSQISGIRTENGSYLFVKIKFPSTSAWNMGSSTLFAPSITQIQLLLNAANPTLSSNFQYLGGSTTGTYRIVKSESGELVFRFDAFPGLSSSSSGFALNFNY